VGSFYILKSEQNILLTFILLTFWSNFLSLQKNCSDKNVEGGNCTNESILKLANSSYNSSMHKEALLKISRASSIIKLTI